MRATLTIPEAAELLGIGRNTAYAEAAEKGTLAGVPVIEVQRRKVLPRAPLLAALGLDDEEIGDLQLTQAADSQLERDIHDVHGSG